MKPLTPEEIDSTDWAAETEVSTAALVKALHKLTPEQRGELYEWVLTSIKAELPLEPNVPYPPGQSTVKAEEEEAAKP